MPFVTGVRFDHIIAREPAIADFIPDHSTTLQTRINEAKAIIDNKLRAMGYDLEKIGAKSYAWNYDNAAGEDEITSAQVSVPSGSSLLILGSPAFRSKVTGTLTVTLVTDGVDYFQDTATLPLGDPSFMAILLPFVNSETSVNIAVDDASFTANTVIVYFTDPAIFMVHIYKALELIYRAMQSDVGDLFQTKADFYREMFEAEFSNIVTAYDLNEDGTTTTQEIQAITSGRRYYR